MDLQLLQKISAQVLSKSIPTYKRWLFEKIDFNSKLIGIKGPRGSGKSTLLLQYAKEVGFAPSKILYISCDHPAVSDESIYNIAESFYIRGGKLFIIDEIHKNKNFSKELKAIYDVFDLQVIFSGSSALEIDNSKIDLSRRAVMHNLGVLSLREFIELQTNKKFDTYSLDEIRDDHYDIVANIMNTIRPLEHFEEYLQYGCYPFYQESLTDYPQKLLEVINITIDSDLSSIYNIEPSKTDKLKKILYMLCTTNPVELNVSKLSSAVGVSWPTFCELLRHKWRSFL